MKITPISKEIHKNWSYVGLQDFKHTSKDSVVPILMAEIVRLVTTNPIVFLKDKNLGLYSLQGLTPERNLLIDRNGKWLNEYIPARYRSLPFVLARDGRSKKKDEKILCYIDDLNCVAENFENKSTKIFNDKSELSEDMKRVFEFLNSIEKNEQLTQIALRAVEESDVIEDWEISLKLADGEKKLSGLKKVNIDKLKSLSDKSLGILNKTGGLDLCFASYYSINNLEKLKNFVILHSNSQNQSNEKNQIETIRDKTLKKQKAAKKLEMDNLVKDLLLDDEI